MENRNKEMDNECNAICQHIDNVANGLILKLTTAEAEMSVADYFSKFYKMWACICFIGVYFSLHIVDLLYSIHVKVFLHALLHPC